MNITKPAVFKNQDELPTGVPITDAYTSAIRELFGVENPSIRRDDPKRPQLIEEFVANTKVEARFVFYPWLNQVVRTVDEETYFKLRTARNRGLISESEQLNYRNCKVGVVGLSVGSSAIRALISSGGPKSLKIADFDELEITNLNRISAGLPDVGNNKTDILAKFAYETDPDADLELWREGVKAETLERFLLEPKLNVFIDEMDNLPLKFLAREICKANKIPVLMATDNGDSVILDIERFDEEPDRKLFHGLVEDINLSEIQNLPFHEWVKVATKIVGPEYLTGKLQTAIMQIGRTIPAVPQLGPTASMAGAGIAMAVRRIANGDSLPSGRIVYGLDSSLIPDYNSDSEVEKRKTVANQMKQALSGNAPQ